MATIADNVTEPAIAPKTIPANAPLLIPELEEEEVAAEIISNEFNCIYR